MHETIVFRKYVRMYGIQIKESELLVKFRFFFVNVSPCNILIGIHYKSEFKECHP